MDNYYHVYPERDLIEHDTEHGLNCPCNPELIDGFVVVHNALDGREIVEYMSYIRKDMKQ